MHAKYGAGHQTQRQLASERLNLYRAKLAKSHRRRTEVSARAAILRAIHGKRAHIKSDFAKIANRRAGAGLRRAQNLQYLRQSGIRPVGVRYMTYTSRARITIRKPTGVIKHFRAEISPGGYYKRSAWGSSRQHHFKKTVMRRQKRFREVKRWRHRGNRYTAR
jgi:hypothetical protein